MEVNIHVAGIDYSMSSPAICVYEGPASNFDFAYCTCYFLSHTKSLAGIHENCIGRHYTDVVPIMEDIPRYLAIANWSMTILQQHRITDAALEGYAMGAKGKVFHIGENTGILKAGIHLADIKLHDVAPTEVKKFATGKGNSDKNAMHQEFIVETGLNLQSRFGKDPQANISSPVSDLVDAFWITKWLVDRMAEEETS